MSSSSTATNSTESSSPFSPADMQRMAEAVARLIRPDNSQHASGGPPSSASSNPISTGNSAFGTAGNPLEGKFSLSGFLANQ